MAVQLSIVVGAVLCVIRFSGGHTWKDLINQMLRLEDPPPLISREVLCTVTMACRRHGKRSGLARKRRQAESSRESKEAARAMSAAL